MEASWLPSSSSKLTPCCSLLRRAQALSIRHILDDAGPHPPMSVIPTLDAGTSHSTCTLDLLTAELLRSSITYTHQQYIVRPIIAAYDSLDSIWYILIPLQVLEASPFSSTIDLHTISLDRQSRLPFSIYNPPLSDNSITPG